MSLPIRRFCVALLACAAVITSALQLPYNPTYAFLSTDKNIVYLLSPSSDQSNFQLSSVDISSSLSAANFSSTTISSSLPFHLDQQTALTATTDLRNNLYLLSGACGDGARGIELWIYNTTAYKTGQSGWGKRSLDTDGIEDPTTNGGVNFLGSAFTFPSGGTASPEIYVFGGLCPNSTSLTVDDWQASASYSNTMLSVQQSTDLATAQFAVSDVVMRGPAIPEAGFTVLPLATAYINGSNSSVGSQQNFAFIGGSTSSAFINMSQVALYSLPEESWSFIPIDAPSPSTSQDLTRKDAPSIDPRSGHAAALSSDGQKIFVVGGWVGNVNTPADPQIAILEVGDGYGGSGDWQWALPDQKNPGPPGLYGHSVTVLPGDVLMISGGYAISAAGSSKLRRRDDPSPNTNTYFYNTSSNNWITSYQNPNIQSNSSSDLASSTLGSSGKLGLGLGLGLGIPLLILAILLLVFGRRMLRKRRQQMHDQDLQETDAAAPYRYHVPGSGGIDGRGGSAIAGQSMQERSTVDPYPWAPAPATAGSLAIGRGSEAERTGLLYDVPSPTRGLRRSLNSRNGNYWYEDGRRSRTSGHIHPIDEEDEGNASNEERVAQARPALIEPNDNIVSAAPVLDPFQETQERHLLDGSRTPSPQSPAREREQEFQGWMHDWTAAEARRQSTKGGRTSPDKSDRTSSTLSDSAHSAVSALSYQHSTGTVNRSSSQRSAALLAANVVPHPSHVSPPESPVSPITPGDYRRSQSFTLGRRHRHTDSASSGPSFHLLQAEGQALLGGTPPQSGSPSRRGHGRARSWMGSVRRVLTGSDRRSIASPERTSPSPEAQVPQRSASAGSMLWRRRQGARDWDYDGRSPGPGGSTGPHDEDWDVESAVENRVVQVMFTVPRERLRVVNAGPSGDAVSVASVEQEVLVETVEEDRHEEENERREEGEGGRS